MSFKNEATLALIFVCYCCCILNAEEHCYTGVEYKYQNPCDPSKELYYCPKGKKLTAACTENCAYCEAGYFQDSKNNCSSCQKCTTVEECAEGQVLIESCASDRNAKCGCPPCRECEPCTYPDNSYPSQRPYKPSLELTTDVQFSTNTANTSDDQVRDSLTSSKSCWSCCKGWIVVAIVSLAIVWFAICFGCYKWRLKRSQNKGNTRKGGKECDVEQGKWKDKKTEKVESGDDVDGSSTDDSKSTKGSDEKEPFIPEKNGEGAKVKALLKDLQKKDENLEKKNAQIQEKNKQIEQLKQIQNVNKKKIQKMEREAKEQIEKLDNMEKELKEKQERIKGLKEQLAEATATKIKNEVKSAPASSAQSTTEPDGYIEADEASEDQAMQSTREKEEGSKDKTNEPPKFQPGTTGQSSSFSEKGAAPKYAVINKLETKRQESVSPRNNMMVTFRYLSKNLSKEWRSVGRNLKILDATLTNIRQDSESEEGAIYNMLLNWQQSNGCDATYDQLIDALGMAGRKDMADDLRRRKDLEGTL